MDKEQATNHIIARINQYQTGDISVEIVIEDVCQYFEMIKGIEISEADKQEEDGEDEKSEEEEKSQNDDKKDED